MYLPFLNIFAFKHSIAGTKCVINTLHFVHITLDLNAKNTTYDLKLILLNVKNTNDQLLSILITLIYKNKSYLPLYYDLFTHAYCHSKSRVVLSRF